MPKMITTIQMIQDAIRLLNSEPDGSKENMQARNSAAWILEAHCDSLQEFANLKTGKTHQVVLSMVSKIKQVLRGTS